MKKLKLLDLFSGIGGFSLGLERSGFFETVAFCENDEDCRKVLDKHWPSVPVFSDIKKLSYGHDSRGVGKLHYKDIDGAGLMTTDIDVICGGFPCQDISVAGKQKGIKDGTRSGLWGEFARLICEIRPQYVIVENVAALLSGDNGRWMGRVLGDLAELGYDAEWNVIPARSVGAPHLRRRLWIIAYPSSQGLERQRIAERVHAKHTITNGAYDESPNPNRSGRQWENSSQSEKRQGDIEPIRSSGRGFISSSESTNISNPNNFRFWKPFASEEEKLKWWAEATASISHWKETQSIVCGVDDGLSGRLDKDRKTRIKQLGNSLLPQIPEIIGRAIGEYELAKD